MPTQICVQNFQEIHTTLNKTKEQYHNLCIEFEKQKRQLDPQQLAQYQPQISSSNLLALSNPNNANTNLLGSSSSPANTPQVPGLLIQNTTPNSQQNLAALATTTPATTSDRLVSLASSIAVSKATINKKIDILIGITEFLMISIISGVPGSEIGKKASSGF